MADRYYLHVKPKDAWFTGVSLRYFMLFCFEQRNYLDRQRLDWGVLGLLHRHHPRQEWLVVLAGQKQAIA